MHYLILDYETRSEADLTEVGAYKYAKHPSTEILCVAWKVAYRCPLTGAFDIEGPTRSWSPHTPGDPTTFLKYMCAPKVKLIAHNALFEQVITRFVLTKYFPHPELKKLSIDKWICTASLAAALALPRKLEKACQALGLPVQKDMDGHKLMLKMSKPRKASKNNKSKWVFSDEKLKRLMQYCRTDVDAEGLLFEILPPLSDQERKIWLLDQKINLQGFKVDRGLIDSALSLTKSELHLLNKELRDLTNGRVESASQRDAFLNYIRRVGLKLPNMQAETIKEYLFRTDLTPIQRRLLEIRQEASKTSTAKYEALSARICDDDRIRDNLLYWGASTGRWAGMGVQPHNFPRGTLKVDTEQAIKLIKTRDLELIRLVYGNPLEILSTCLRGVITANEGEMLFCEDFSAIEARVVQWLSGDTEGLNLFIKGDDPYWHMAVAIYGFEVPKKGPERELGKRAELGCGFGMGWKKFLETCHKAGMKHVTPELAKKAVKIYRKKHKKVVDFWYAQEKAAILAVASKKKINAGKINWFMDGKILYCELPSKRRLAYYNPSIKYVETPWGEKRATLFHWQENPEIKQWVNEKTYGGRLVENIVQAVARDFMAEAMLRADDKKYKMVLTVHDELLAEKANGAQKEFSRLVGEIPEWGKGCPIKNEGWMGFRYRK